MKVADAIDRLHKQLCDLPQVTGIWDEVQNGTPVVVVGYKGECPALPDRVGGFRVVSLPLQPFTAETI
jgi:hypothetical protein